MPPVPTPSPSPSLTFPLCPSPSPSVFPTTMSPEQLIPPSIMDTNSPVVVPTPTLPTPIPTPKVPCFYYPYLPYYYGWLLRRIWLSLLRLSIRQW